MATSMKFTRWLESQLPSWRDERDEQQMQIDPPQDPNNLYHVTTDKSMLLKGGAPHTSSFGRQGLHVFDNIEDAQWYHQKLLKDGHQAAEVVRVAIPVQELKPDWAHMGRAYIAQNIRPEYLR